MQRLPTGPLPPRSSCTLKCIMDTEGQPCETAVNKGVINGDANPSDFQDAPVIQPPLSDHLIDMSSSCTLKCIKGMEGQPFDTGVNKGVTNGDVIPSGFQDAPVIQPPLSDLQKVASQSQKDNQQLLQAFWPGQLAEIKQTTNFKTHSLPLARIKKIMKDDTNVPKRVVGEAPLLFGKACEMPQSSPKGVTNRNANLSDFKDAPVIQPPLSDLQKVASQSQKDNQQLLQAFWSGQLAEIKQTTNFKTHSLPLARIKKIMKADTNVPKRVAGEAPLLFAKACEMFIQELTLRAWLHTEEDKRRTLQKNDVKAALASTEVFDFLVADGSSDKKPKGNDTPPTTAKDDDSYGDYYWDDYSPPWSPEPPSPDLHNVTCDDPRYYTYIHDYYSL